MNFRFEIEKTLGANCLYEILKITDCLEYKIGGSGTLFILQTILFHRINFVRKSCQ